MVNRIKHDSESKRTQIKNMNKHVFICLFIFFVCVLQDSLSCLILIYRKWPSGCNGIARGVTAGNDVMFNVIYSNLKHCFFWKQKTEFGKATKTGSPHPPPLLTDPDYCTHVFFWYVQKRETRELSLSSDNDAQVATSCIIIFVYRL